MMIHDLNKATAADMDLDLIERKLWNIRRFQGHPDALMVRAHTHLVRALAVRGNASGPVIEWCFYHDDHEALIGDINGTVVWKIDGETPVLSDLSAHIDHIICEARGINYPTQGDRREVHFYDKLAESLETRFGLGWPPYKNHPEWPAWLDDDRARTLFMSYATLENPHL